MKAIGSRVAARETVTMLIDQLFAEQQRRIFADTELDNHSSIALLA